ncbi:HAD family hydrolase [Nanoarchaeota archaeon]
MAIKAVFFDFWGTLFENGTYSPLRQTYKLLRVRMHFGDFVQKFEDSFMTKTFETQEDAFNEAIVDLGLRPRKFLIDKLIGLWNKNRLLAEPYEETFEVLNELKKNHKLVLLSNTDCFVQTVFDKCNFENYFDETALSFKTGFLKTNPRLFEVALKKIKVKAEEALMVGDSLETDIVGAKRAGLNVVLIDRRNRRDFSPKIQNLKELKRFL